MSEGRLEVQPNGSTRDQRVNNLTLCSLGVIGGWFILALSDVPTWLLVAAAMVSVAAPIVTWLVSAKLADPSTIWLDDGMLGCVQSARVREVPVATVLDATYEWIPYRDANAVFRFPNGLSIECRITAATKPFLAEVLSTISASGRSGSISGKLATKIAAR